MRPSGHTMPGLFITLNFTIIPVNTTIQVMNDNYQKRIQTLLRAGRRMAMLEVENARLTTAEKLSLFCSTVAFYGIFTVIAIVALVFVSIGIGHLLAATVAPHLAYLFIAAFYVILLVLLIVLRRQLFTDPVTRFISRLIVTPPASARTTAQPQNADEK